MNWARCKTCLSPWLTVSAAPRASWEVPCQGGLRKWPVARGPWRLYAFLQTMQKHRREFFTIRHFILTPSLCPQVTSIILLAL